MDINDSCFCFSFIKIHFTHSYVTRNGKTSKATLQFTLPLQTNRQNAPPALKNGGRVILHLDWASPCGLVKCLDTQSSPMLYVEDIRTKKFKGMKIYYIAVRRRTNIHER